MASRPGSARTGRCGFDRAPGARHGRERGQRGIPRHARRAPARRSRRASRGARAGPPGRPRRRPSAARWATCSRSSRSTPARPRWRSSAAASRTHPFACEHHADQRRKMGEDFIVHPVGVAKICAGMRLDTETLCAALMHDTVEDTSASLDEVRERFGEEVANLVDGVTKLTGITFTSRDEAQAENYRKMTSRWPRTSGSSSSSSPTACTTCARSARCPSRSRSTRPRRPWTSTRRSRTGSASTRSSGSWRTSPSPRCTRASTRRSRAWSTSSARSARATSAGPAPT